MKNLTFLVIALFMSSNVFAQKGLKIGLQFTPGATASLQNEDFDRGEDLNLDPTFGYNFGLTLGYGITETFSISTGIMFNNHVSQFVHDREFLSNTSLSDPNYKKKFARTLGYVRVPVLFEVGSDPTQAGGFFFRIGPHFDFLTGGKYTDQRLEGFSNYDTEKGIDLTGQTALWEPAADKKSAVKTSEMGDIYNKVVVGVTLEIGGQIRLTDYLKMILTVHLESALTNPEGVGASSFTHNIYDEVSADNPLSLAGIADAAKATTEQTPFQAMYPNYTNADQRWATERGTAFNVMGGVTLGVIYTLDFSN